MKNRLIGLRKNEDSIELNVLVFQLIIYYKKKYGIKIGISIYNIMLEISLTNWKYNPIWEVINKD